MNDTDTFDHFQGPEPDPWSPLENIGPSQPDIISVACVLVIIGCLTGLMVTVPKSGT